MKIGSNCFLIKCEVSRTMKDICTLVSKGDIHWIVEVKSNPKEKYYALPHHIRAPKNGEVKAGVRLFD